MSVGLLALLSAMLVAIVVGGFVASRGLQGELAAHVSWMQLALFAVPWASIIERLVREGGAVGAASVVIGVGSGINV